MAGTIARKAIDHLKSKEFRDYLMRCVFDTGVLIVIYVYIACMLNHLACYGSFQCDLNVLALSTTHTLYTD